MKLVHFLIFSSTLYCTSCTLKNPVTESVISEVKDHNGKSTIKGVVNDYSNENIIGARVTLIQDDVQVTEVMTEFDGSFVFKNIPDGIYDLEVNFVGYSSKIIKDIKVPGENNSAQIELVVTISPGAVSLKPIIYLYPEEETKVHVEMNYQGELMHTYPRYGGQGWDVTASPDGTLIDSSEQEYYALYWEGLPDVELQITDGFMVKGSNTISFLETKLSQLGLNRREANEFIVFWLPLLENSPYNAIHFSTIEYAAQTNLSITPKPETAIRIMMVYQPLQQPLPLKEQKLEESKLERKGFTIVEWGGTIAHNLSAPPVN